MEDVLPIYDVDLSVRTGVAPRRAYLAPQGADLPVDWDGAYAKVRVPKVEGHQIVAFAL